MAMNALDERINKIRQQNEEIRRRHEEVEEDKKNAAKSNALVQMVPSSDWPQRKEPPEFSTPPKPTPKPKPSNKEHTEHPQHGGSGDGKKGHTFARGEGPPPDPKYNFLADSEREEYVVDSIKESGIGRGRGKPTRGNFKKRGIGREGPRKDNRMPRTNHRDEYHPEYDAWKAERNRIDEDRISRQRTAEGNWRREWDNDKVHVIDDGTKRESRPSGNFVKKEHKDYDKRYNADGNDHINYRGNNYRSHQSGKNYHGHDYRYDNSHDHHGQTSPKASSNVEGRTVIATDKSIKVTLSQSNRSKGQVTSVKVNSPSIAGTGRVGPRQRTRVTYSSHSDVETTAHTNTSFARQKSFEDESDNVNMSNAEKPISVKRSHSNLYSNSYSNSQVQRKKENNVKSPYAQRRDFKREDEAQNEAQKHYHDSQKPKISKKDEEPQKEEDSSKMQGTENLSFGNSACAEFERKEKSEDDKHCVDNELSVTQTFNSEEQHSSAPIESATFNAEINENLENNKHVCETETEDIGNLSKDNTDSFDESLNRLSTSELAASPVEAKSIEETGESASSTSPSAEHNESLCKNTKDIENDVNQPKNLSVSGESVSNNKYDKIKDEIEHDKEKDLSTDPEKLIEEISATEDCHKINEITETVNNQDKTAEDRSETEIQLASNTHDEELKSSIKEKESTIDSSDQSQFCNNTLVDENQKNISDDAGKELSELKNDHETSINKEVTSVENISSTINNAQVEDKKDSTAESKESIDDCNKTVKLEEDLSVAK